MTGKLFTQGLKQAWRPGRMICLWIGAAVLTMLSIPSGFTEETYLTEPAHKTQINTAPVISKLMPERKHGRGFKLEYSVNASLDVFWRYKTDFDNQHLLRNKLINSHRLVSRDGDVVITETEYSNKPNVVFRWKTTVFPDQYLLKYELLNPDECGQKYHYGFVQLEGQGLDTRVTQVAYFDFFGVSFWVNYPFKGGMSRFLKYTAQWEREYISEYANQIAN
jgi:hypothetical protein